MTWPEPTPAERSALQWLVGRGVDAVISSSLEPYYQGRRSIKQSTTASMAMVNRLKRKGFINGTVITRIGRRAAQ